MQKHFVYLAAASMAVGGWAWAQQSTPGAGTGNTGNTANQRDDSARTAGERSTTQPSGMVGRDTMPGHDMALTGQTSSIHRRLAEVTDAAVNKDQIKNLPNYFSKDAKDRFKEFGQKDDQQLSSTMEQFNKAWKEKYGKDFNIGQEQMVFNSPNFRIMGRDLGDTAQPAGERSSPATKPGSELRPGGNMDRSGASVTPGSDANRAAGSDANRAAGSDANRGLGSDTARATGSDAARSAGSDTARAAGSDTARPSGSDMARPGSGDAARSGIAGAGGSDTARPSGSGTVGIGGPDLGQAQPAAGRDMAASQHAWLRISASHGLPELSVPLSREQDQWAISVPVTLTADRLRSNLNDHFKQLLDQKDQWPADATQAYQTVSHHVFMALLDRSGKAGEGQPAGMDQNRTGADQNRTGDQAKPDENR